MLGATVCAVAAEAAEAAKRRMSVVLPHLTERGQRLLLGVEARELGYGGVSAVAALTGVARSTVQRGREEIEQPHDLPLERSRRAGAGRKSVVSKDPDLVAALEAMVDPATRGDPESPLRWTSKSTRQLADALSATGHPVGERTTAALLHQQGYSLQGNAKTREGRQHPDRDAQFRYINEQVRRFLKAHHPVISVDTKKKELIGADPGYKNAGREWEPKQEPVKVGVHDFPDPEVPKAIPYGVYDLAANAGWVSVGSDGDTAAFAAETLRRWWSKVGSARYRSTRRLLVCADAGGSNGYRLRLWKVELAKLADETGLRITVCHFPPGTSKWNKIEHRLFAHISMNWRGRPLISHEVVVELIGATTTRTGLTVHAEADTNVYPRGVKVSEAEMAALQRQLKAHDFHGEWNYTVKPSSAPAP
jgi:hypothetical protein